MYNFTYNEFNPFISGMMVFFTKSKLQKIIKNDDIKSSEDAFIKAAYDAACVDIPKAHLNLE